MYVGKQNKRQNSATFMLHILKVENGKPGAPRLPMWTLLHCTLFFCICTLHVSPVVNGNILDIISVGIERCQLGFNLCIAQAMQFTHGFDAQPAQRYDTL